MIVPAADSVSGAVNAFHPGATTLYDMVQAQRLLLGLLWWLLMQPCDSACNACLKKPAADTCCPAAASPRLFSAGGATT
jgi:hypothetical protein